VANETNLTSGELVEKIYECLPERNRINRNRDSIHILLDGQKVTMEIQPNRDNSHRIKYSVSSQGEATAWINPQRHYHGEIDTRTLDFKPTVETFLADLTKFMSAIPERSPQSSNSSSTQQPR
jgi:hypothetical protein